MTATRWSATGHAYAGPVMELRSAIRSGGLAWAALGAHRQAMFRKRARRTIRSRGGDHPARASHRAAGGARRPRCRSHQRGGEINRATSERRSGIRWRRNAIVDGGELTAPPGRARAAPQRSLFHGRPRAPHAADRDSHRGGLLLDPETRAAAEERRELLQTVERNAERLQRLADTTLELARFRAGQIRLQLRRFDARELGDEVRLALGPVLDAKDQRLTLAVGDQPVWVFADHRRIERAILNLVSNAHKFSEPGSEIRLAVRRMRRGRVLGGCRRRSRDRRR